VSVGKISRFPYFSWAVVQKQPDCEVKWGGVDLPKGHRSDRTHQISKEFKDGGQTDVKRAMGLFRVSNQQVGRWGSYTTK